MADAVRKNYKGITLFELITAMALLGIIMSVVTNFFSLAGGYYYLTAAQVDTLSGSEIAVRRLSAELQETDAASVQFSSAHDALIFVSARSLSAGKFVSDSATGTPKWQKWVYYGLIADPNGPYSLLIRKEWNGLSGASIPAGGTSTDQTPPSDWQTQFQNYTGNQTTIAAGVQTFQVQDCNCDAGTLLHSPYYIQVISSIQYRGQTTNYNPGYGASAISSCAFSGGTGSPGCTSGGNWVQAQVINP